MARLNLNRDFSRFLEDETFPHRVEVHFGDKPLICSGMVLAQQSSIIEQLIRDDCGTLMFEKMKDIGDEEQKVDCIKYMYGTPIALNLQNINTAIKFASLYGVMDLFHKSLQWIKNNLTARNMFGINDISESFEIEDHKTKLNKAVSNFITKNIDTVGAELAERIAQDDGVNFELFVSIVKQNPKNGANVLREWTKRGSEKKMQVLEAIKEFDVVTLFPNQEDFTGFVTLLSYGLDSVDVMKQVLALQQDYFVKSALKKSMPTAAASTTESNPEDSVQQEEEKEEEQEHIPDDSVSVASSASTANTASSKPKSQKKGRSKQRQKNRSENLKSHSNPGPQTAQSKPPNQKQQNIQNEEPKSGNKPTAAQVKHVNQPKNQKKQKSQNPKPGSNDKRKIFVANVPKNASVNDIKQPFLFCGTIVHIDVQNYSQRNIAFIEFISEQSAATVLSAVKGGVKFTVLGEAVYVKEYISGKGSKPNQANLKSSVV